MLSNVISHFVAILILETTIAVEQDIMLHYELTKYISSTQDGLN